MRKTVRRVVAWGVGIGLAAVIGVAGAAGAVDGDGAVWFEPPAGTVGQNLQLIGLGFPADTDVLVMTSASPDPTVVGKSAGDGTFTLPFTVPDLAPGQHQVDVRVGERAGVLNLFVLPSDSSLPGNDGTSVELNPDAAAVGEDITVLAGNFTPFQELCVLVKADPPVTECLGMTGSDGNLYTSWKVPDIRPGKYQMFVFTGQIFDTTELTILAADDPSPSPSPSDSASPHPSASTETPTPTSVASPTFTPTTAPQLAASGTPDVGGVVPWGVAALVAAAVIGVHRLRSRAKG